MANLYELTETYLKLQQAVEDDESFNGVLETIDDELEEKAEGYACIIRNLESDIQGMKAEEERLKTRRKQYENKIDKLRQTLLDAMIKTGKKKFKTKLFSFTVRKGSGNAVKVDVETDKLKDEFVIVTEKPDLKAIGKYIEETGDVSFAHLEQRSETLMIK